MGFLVGAFVGVLIFVLIFKGILNFVFGKGYPLSLVYILAGFTATSVYYWGRNGEITLVYMLGAAFWYGVDRWRRRQLASKQKDLKGASEDTKVAI